MIRLVQAEMRKLIRTPGMIIATLLCGIFVVYVYWQTSQNVMSGLWAKSLIDPRTSFTYTMAALATVGPLLAPVVGAVAIGQEFSYRTWDFLLTHGTPRWGIWLVKVVSVLLAMIGWVVLSLLSGYGLSMFITGHVAPPVMNGQVLSQVGTVFFSLAFWALFSLACAVGFHGSAAGVAAGMGFPFAEMFLEQISWLRNWLPVWNQKALNAAVFGTKPIGMAAFFSNPGYPSPGMAVLTLALLTAVVISISYLLVQRVRTPS